MEATKYYSMGANLISWTDSWRVLAEAEMEIRCCLGDGPQVHPADEDSTSNKAFTQSKRGTVILLD